MITNINRIFLVALLSLISLSVVSQEGSLKSLEEEMLVYQDSIRLSKSEEQRIQSSEKFREKLMDVLNTSGAFSYPFDLWTTVSTISSPDNYMRIFNWNVPLDDDTHKYFCFILTQDIKNEIYDWYELSDYTRSIDKVDIKYLEAEKWLGALYYEIVPLEKGKNSKYVVLGWDGNNRSTTKKIIDVIGFTKKGIKLGAPIFKTDKGTKKRYILEYSSDVMVSLRWFKKEQRIVFDHLAPRESMMTGVYSYYGPDFSYEAFNLKKGKFTLEHDVEVTMSKDKSNKPYNDPR